MEEAWKALEAAGLPDGAPRPRPTRLDFPALRGALGALDARALSDLQRVILLAWLEGWRHHWPSRFERELGSVAGDLCAQLASRPIDQNRYLKLRRIAVENLSAVL